MSESELNNSIDKFKNGTFWELYKDLEHQFENFLEYVPYLEGNETIYSFRLLNLILSIGGYVDSAFKEMARCTELSDNKDCKKILTILEKPKENVTKGKAPKTIPISLSIRAFEKEYHLSKKKVLFKSSPRRQEVIPFKPHNNKTKAPKWWEIYNGLKHDVGVNLTDANLFITRNALAGAFLLNVMHFPGVVRLYKLGILKPSLRGPAYFTYGPRGVENLKKILKEKGGIGFVETSLFIYDYEQKNE